MRIAPSVIASAERMIRTRSSPRCSVSVMTSSGDFIGGRSSRRRDLKIMTRRVRGVPSRHGQRHGSSPPSVRLIRSSPRRSGVVDAAAVDAAGRRSARSRAGRRRRPGEVFVAGSGCGSRRAPLRPPSARAPASTRRRARLSRPARVGRRRLDVTSTAWRSRSAVSRISFIGSSSTLRISVWKLLPIFFSSAYVRRPAAGPREASPDRAPRAPAAG